MYLLPSSSINIGNFLIIFTIIYFQIISIQEISCNHRVKRIVGGRPAAKPPPDDPVVFIRLYDRYSRIEGYRNNRTGIYTFLGIHYADPPIGNNRFTRPRYRRPQGNINATINGPPCPQPDPNNPQILHGKEDCLLLNIYTPQMPDETTGLPVYVWIHPGGFRYGSASQYDAEPLAQQGIIFVPVQYRLGTLGVLGEGTKDFSGNLAMLDMTVALRWVTEYISFFGGNPKQIKVIGHGSGAASAMYLSMSKMPRSGGTQINGVVSMSGSALSQYATDTDPVQSVQEIAAINECSTTNETEIIKCMRKKSIEDIVLRDSEIQTERLQGRAMVKGIAGNIGFNPHVEVENDQRALPGFLTSKPNDIIKDGKFIKIPLLIGVTKHETGNGIALNKISKIWGDIEKFLKSLLGNINELKNFLKIDKKTGELLKPILPGINDIIGDNGIGINDLLKIPKNLEPEQVLAKLTETTTDILFNLPAVLSAELWGYYAPSYLYSFEHKSTDASIPTGYNILNGLPIVSNKPNKNFTGHGDELGYLFNINDIYGRPINNKQLKNDEDIQVRINFITLFKKFSQINVFNEFDGNDDVGGGGSEGDDGGGNEKFFDNIDNSIFKKFTGKGTPFIKITNEIELKDNFRFCELSLWGAPIEAIQSTTCQGLLNSFGLLNNVLNNATNTLTDQLGLGNGGVLMGIGGNERKRNNNNNNNNVYGNVSNNKNTGLNNGLGSILSGGGGVGSSGIATSRRPGGLFESTGSFGFG